MTAPTSTSQSDASSAYHSVTSPDFALTERIRIHIEDGLFDTAIANTESILFSGLSAQHPTPGLLVPPTYLRFFTTLLCHPFYTTQVRTKSLPVTGPESAHLLLRRIINVVGPISADLEAAWKFSSSTEARAGRRKHGAQGRGVRSTASPDGDSDDHITGALANEESLFSVADDFWAVVGWALNCSVKHKARWRHWRNVLDVMILGLERDWADRYKRYQKALEKERSITANRDADSPAKKEPAAVTGKRKFGSAKSAPRDSKRSSADVHLNSSLIMSFLPSTYGSAGYKRVIRAIFADGSEKSMAEFKELWPDELSRRRKKISGRQDIGKTMARDQPEEDSSDEEDDRLNGEKEKEDVDMEDKDRPVNALDLWGGIDAVEYRQRLLTLVTTICYNDKFIPLEDLFLQLHDTIRPLPLPSFHLFTSGLLPAHPTYRNCLAQTILDSIRSPTSTVSRFSVKDEDNLTLSLFTTHYAPCTANTVTASENAKMTMMIEVLARLLWQTGELAWSEELERAVEEGIVARRKKGTRARPGERKEEVLRIWEDAERRLRLLMRVAKQKV